MLFSLGSALSQVFIAVTVHLLLVFPTGRFESRIDRLIAAAAYYAAGVLYVAAFVFADPVAFGCPECPRNSLLIDDEKPLADALSMAVSTVFAAVALALVLRLLTRWLRATPVQRRALAAVALAGGALAVLLFGATTIIPVAGADSELAGVMAIGALVPFGLVPYLFVGSLVRTRIIRGGAFRGLVDGLGEGSSPAGLRDALARTLGDPSVELAFWLPESSTYVDAAGSPVEVRVDSPRRAVSEIRHRGRLVAAIIHDSALLDDPELVRGVGAAAALALDNARLDAELRAKARSCAPRAREQSRRRSTSAVGSSATFTTGRSSGSCLSRSNCASPMLASTTTPRARASYCRPLAASSRRHSESCASSRAGSIPRCFLRAVSTQPWRWS